MLKAQLSTLQGLYDTHTHIAGTLVIPGSPPVAVTGISGVPVATQQLHGSWPGDMGAAKVVSE